MTASSVKLMLIYDEISDNSMLGYHRLTRRSRKAKESEAIVTEQYSSLRAAVETDLWNWEAMAALCELWVALHQS
jgi:hypothetical protein